MSAEPVSEPLRVAVRRLCDFAARAGDLDHRFTPAPSAFEGIAGHASVAARRPAHYQRERTLSGLCEGLLLQGRADGYDPQARRLDETKTHRGDPTLITPNRQALHWAQAQVYGWLLCEAENLDAIELALIYYDIDSGHETVLTRQGTRDSLRAFTQDLCTRYRDWAWQEAEHRRARDAALATMPFPFEGYRAGQRELTEAVFRSQRAGRHLLAQAPTGIGKTVATLFGALRAMPVLGSDQLLVLTPKTTGRAIALDGLRRLNAQPMRVLERLAREKACEHPDKACHGESCPLAQGFYDRLGGAREAAARVGWLDREALREIALAHRICPYYLAQEMQRWADVVVGDVNHWFDLNAQAWSLAQAEGWRVQLLLDEAHNLAERARRMYSAELDPQRFGAWRAQAPKALKATMDSVHRAWGALAPQAPEAAPDTPALDDALPAAFMATLGRHVATLTDFMARHPQAAVGLQPWLFEAVHFLRVAERFGAHSVVERSPGPPARRGNPRPRLALRCLLPAELLTPRWAGAHAATLFSATLAPMAHAQRLLGLPEPVARLEVDSPFDPAQWSVRVARGLSTRWADRVRTLPRLVDELGAHYRAHPGNHLAFFSSFDYLTQAMEAFRAAHPDVTVWSQSRSMDEAAREAFIARFVEGGQGMGFAVLGGVFGEGIDLPGSRLVGVSIATLGLPPPDALSEALRERLQHTGAQGWADTYLYPGLHKVVQAAGRLIRTPQDRGTLLLLDERFASPEVRALLPPWWGVR
ncbi:ATP-dependent DNA helicase [Hydrogenophaga sp. PBC]|uniref:ATP-dependent DNA helicase n=1 Tax=Hydrogenophaga sp. PBC TaxID=795665 RepID=UPI000854D7FD|nr:ATP-dependent DNA helicase [Hydrogenophaga sp. PBC]AOS78131.1 ATP-dependent DNA helicase [Hydrogenophaga sp. PBC]